MDREGQRRVNEAAEKFAAALRESYRALADRSVAAREPNAEATRRFFDGVLSNLRAQAEGNRALAEGLIGHQRGQQEASRALAREGADAYVEFLGSVFSFYGRGTGAATGEAGPGGRPSEGRSGAVGRSGTTFGHPRTTFGGQKTTFGR